MGTGAVVIEADAIKNRDAVYRTLQALEGQHSESEKDLSQYVHDYSTRAAESMLVTAGVCYLSMLVSLCCALLEHPGLLPDT